MKHLSFTAAALSALALAACTSNSDLTQITPPTNPAEEETPVAFDTYVAKTANTRAGYQGAISNTTNLQSTSDNNGFGVFAYYTGTESYSASATPNFMYNQQVTYSSGWTYSPVKYWPNDIATSAVDNQSPAATGSEAGGKVSFFAYAPYVYVTTDVTTNNQDGSTATLGKEMINNGGTGAYQTLPAGTSQKGTAGVGITTITGNTATGDPVVTYVLNTTTPQNNVDLLWGTAGKSTSGAGSYTNVIGSTVSATNTTIEHASGDYYQVWKDCTKQKSGNALNFDFVHALAKIGSITLAMDPNSGATATGGTGSFGNTATLGYTNVTVQSITLKYTGTNNGTFNLATGAWSSTGSTDYTYTLNNNTLLNNNIYYNNSSEAASFNAFPEGVTGVTGSSTTTEALGSDNPLLYFIPTGSDFALTITIQYTLRTYDPNLSQGWSKVTQTISKVVTFSGGLQLNKNYTLNLKLGVEDIDVSASYADWDSGSSESVNLPINVSGS